MCRRYVGHLGEILCWPILFYSFSFGSGWLGKSRQGIRLTQTRLHVVRYIDNDCQISKTSTFCVVFIPFLVYCKFKFWFTMSFATFPSSWSPPTTCFLSTDIYIVATEFAGLTSGTSLFYYNFWYGVGSTAPSGECIPPSYSTSSPYYAQSCPPDYQEALASKTTISDQKASAILCCPG